jgi:hypothetical protein
MNAMTLGEQAALNLVEIVELKWMLAGEGVHIHVERLQSDAGYARHILATADRSANATVRSVAQRVRRQLDLPPPAAN